MSKIIPEKIKVASVKLLSSNLYTTDDFIRSKTTSVHQVRINYAQNSSFDLKAKKVRIILNIQLIALDKDEKEIGLTGEYEIDFILHIENFNEFLKKNKQGNAVMDSALGSTLMGIVYSTARGIILERTQGTFFNGVILPVMNPNKLIKTKDK